MEESNLMRHARRELQEAGWFSLDSDYGGLIGEAVMQMMEQFSSEGHSGCSADICLGLFQRLARYKLLVPINNPMESGEYMDHSDKSGYTCYQSTRLSSLFSNDGGKNWHDIDGPTFPRWIQLILRRPCPYVKFPYLPK